MLVNRRGLLLGLGAVLAAPAIVHAGNLMPVSSRMITHPYDMLICELPDGREHRWHLTGKEPGTRFREIAEMYPDGELKKLRAIVRPTEEPTYDLRDDIRAAFQEHGL